MGICSGISTDRTGSSSTVFQVKLAFRNVGFGEGEKPEKPVKNSWSRDETQQQTKLTYCVNSRIQAQAALVGGKCS